MTDLIVAENLSKAFGRNQAVDGISLRVAPGEAYGLVGADGAGKTTTMRLLCGALRTDSGRAVLGGFDLARQTEQARALIGYLPQRFSLYGELTVRENLHFFAEVRGLAEAEWQPRSKEILDFVGLSEFADRRAEMLSGGMKQKLGLAAALVHRPRILLLDEPTGGVDPVTRQGFWQLLIRLLREGVAVVISTPYMDEASRCNRVGFVNRGKLLLEGSPAEVCRRLEGRVLELVGRPRRALVEVASADPAVQDVHTFGDRLHLRVAAGTAQAAIERLERAIPAAGATFEQLRPIPPQLEDAFIDILGADTLPRQ
ncbi:MAG TPA: ABC transporter ATP-binding protein [Anaerolineales bacterium]|nr:ABC transporter ATP-binding protein [Anaerolineales bacterium]